MSTALGIQQTTTGIGTSASDMRHILAAQWECTGVVDGLAVTGGTSLAYAVASGVAVCSKGASDGKTLAWFAGGTTPTVAASDASSPRIDAVWVTAHDASQGDADNLVTLGVTQGTPAATPVAPTIPAYATLLATMMMPAGATTTANATAVSGTSYAVPYGASLGILVDQVDTSSATYSSERVACSGTFTLPTDRIVDVSAIVTCSVNGGKWANSEGSVYVTLLLDGVDKRAFEVRSWPQFAGSSFFGDAWSIAAGTHTVTMRVKCGVCTSWTQYYSAAGWAGQQLRLTDAGVAR